MKRSPGRGNPTKVGTPVSLSIRLERRCPQMWQRLRLSRRESQIVRGLLDGEAERQIAEVIGISSHTVRAYMQRTYRKLRVNSRAELLLHVFRTYVAIRDGQVEEDELATGDRTQQDGS